MLAVLIDPFACRVADLDLPDPPRPARGRVSPVAAQSEQRVLSAIYAALSHETMPVDYVEAVELGGGEHLLVDEEGKIKQDRGGLICQRYFRLRGYHETLAGKGLILGAEPSGTERSTRFTVEMIRPRVMYLELAGPFIRETTRPWQRMTTAS